MDKERFVRAINQLKPSEQDFKTLDVPESFAREEIARYHCEPKANVQLKILTNDGILRLLQNYDCSSVGIGNLSFEYNVVEYPGYYQIGKVEIDILVLNKITHEIEVRDHDSLDHVIWVCSSNGERFLDALLLCAEYFRSLLNDLSIGDDNLHLLTVVIECAEKAGGDKYVDFYKMLLGYFD